MSDHTVLVVPTEPLIGALLVLFIESQHYRAVLADRNEAPSDAVATSGATIIVVDVDRRDGFSPEFIAEQRRLGRSVIAYSPRLLVDELQARAAQVRVPSLHLPIDLENVRRLLHSAAHDASAAISPRREIPNAPRAPEASP